MLRGARLVTAPGDRGRPALGRGEDQDADRRRPHRRPVHAAGLLRVHPQFTLLIAGNHKPGLRSVDEAIRRRFHLDPVHRHHRPRRARRDLPEKLRAEWPGILAWAIDGCLAWQQQGLRPPAVVRAATEAYLDGQDAFGAWLEECCDSNPNAWSRRTELFASWQTWAEEAREFVLPRARFFDTLETRGFAEKRKPGARGFQGLALKQHDYSEAHWQR